MLLANPIRMYNPTYRVLLEALISSVWLDVSNPRTLHLGAGPGTCTAIQRSLCRGSRPLSRGRRRSLEVKQRPQPPRSMFAVGLDTPAAQVMCTCLAMVRHGQMVVCLNLSVSCVKRVTRNTSESLPAQNLFLHNTRTPFMVPLYWQAISRPFDSGKTSSRGDPQVWRGVGKRLR